MDAMVEIEQASEAGQNLAQVVGRFSVWRASRKAGGRIPAELWAVAVDMAKVHGLYRMSKELRLDYCGLKRRLEGAGGDVQPGLLAVVSQRTNLAARPRFDGWAR